MDASGGEIVQLSTGKDDSNVHPPRIGEASATLVVGSPQFDSAPLLLRPPVGLGTVLVLRLLLRVVRGSSQLLK